MQLSEFSLVQEQFSWSGSDSGIVEAESEQHFVLVDEQVVVVVVDGSPDYH